MTVDKNKFFPEYDEFDESILQDILNEYETAKIEPIVHDDHGQDPLSEWRLMEEFLQTKSDELSEEHHITWQELYEQSYSALFEKYQILGMNEYALRMEMIRLKQMDSLEKWYRKKPFHEHFAIMLAQKLSRVFFVIDTGELLDKKYHEACSMFPYQQSDLLTAIREGLHNPYDMINELQLMMKPEFYYRTQTTEEHPSAKTPVDFIKYLLSLLKDNEKVAGGHVIHHTKDIMKIFKIIATNLVECEKIIKEQASSRFKTDEIYYYEKRRLATLDNDIWYVYQALHAHNLTMIGFLDLEKVSKAGKMMIWKYLDRLTLSYLFEISMFRIPLETDIPDDPQVTRDFTGDIDHDIWVASFNRFWRLELLDYSLGWIRRLKQTQKWNIPSLKFIREVVPVNRTVK